MPVADTNQASLAWAVESTFGTAPSGAYQRVRYTSESLGRNSETTVSDEIRSDAQVADTIRVGVDAGGDVGFELSHGAHDEWFRYGLRSGAWAGAVAAPVVDIAVSLSSPNTLFTRSGGSWGTDGFVAGQIARMSGFGTANDGYWKIVQVSGATLTCEGTGVVQSSGSGRSIAQLNQIVSGTSLSSMTIEREYENLTNQYAALSGMAIQSFSLDSPKREKVSGSFTFLGQDEVGATSSVASSKTAATTNRVYSVTGDLDTFVFTGDRSARMTAFRLNYENGLYVIDHAGSLTPDDIGQGEANCSGSFEFYYEDQSVFDDYESFGDVSFLLGFEDASGNGMVFDITRANLTSGRRNSSGKSAGVIGTTEWQASRHATEGVTMRIART